MTTGYAYKLPFNHFILLALLPNQIKHLNADTKGNTIKEQNLPGGMIDKRNRTVRCDQHLWRSFCMRALLWPGVKFWYDVSILGLTLAPYAFFCQIK